MQTPSLTFPLKTFHFANGLTLYLDPQPDSSMTALQLCYGVGSANELPGQTGLAHLCEHLMFEGSLNHDDDYFRPLEHHGASVNASTSRDTTQYYCVVNHEVLELALWLERDRMLHLLAALTLAKFENQRSVVRNERRQRYDNEPYGLINERMLAMLYPPGHPYHWPVIGHDVDLQAMTLEQVRAFLSHYYRPSNLVVTISGNVEPDAMVALVERYLGNIPDQPSPTDRLRVFDAMRKNPPDLMSRPEGSLRQIMEDDVSSPRLDLVWLTSPRFSADEMPLDFAASILAGRSRQSRLNRELVINRRLVTSISAGNATFRRAGEFRVATYAFEAGSLPEIESIIHAEIENLISNPPTEPELARVRMEFLLGAIGRTETALGRASLIGQSHWLSRQVTPELLQHEIDAADLISADDIVRVVTRYLRRPCITFTTLPKQVDATTSAPTKIAGQQKASAAAEAQPLDKSARVGAVNIPTRLTDLPSAANFAPPAVYEHFTPSGVRILHFPATQTPKSYVDWVMPTGIIDDPVDQRGLAHLTGNVLDEGTTRLSSAELTDVLDQLGARIRASFGVHHGTMSVISLTRHLRSAHELLLESLTAPRFDPADIERERKRTLVSIAHRQKDPDALASEAIDQLIYGTDHPYALTGLGTADSLSSIGAADIQQFHAQHVQATQPLILSVGPHDPESLVKVIKQWSFTPGKIASSELDSSNVASADMTFIPREQASQATLRVGFKTIPRAHADYVPMLIINTILGGQFVSRLNANLREKRGITYGVRTSFQASRMCGSFIASTTVDKAATWTAVDAICDELASISTVNPITADELEYAKRYLVRRFPARFESASSRLAHLYALALYDLPIDYFAHWTRHVAALTLDQIHDCARRHFDRRTFKIAVSADESIRR